MRRISDRGARTFRPLAWYPGRGSNPHALFREAADFKSAVYTSFTTRAARDYRRRMRWPNDKGLAVLRGLEVWRRDPESNRAERICNPVHNRFAIAP
jgi:hypothetical protein